MYTLGCQPRYKVAMVVNTIKFFSKNFQESEFKFPVEKNSLVFDHQHGYHRVQPARIGNLEGLLGKNRILILFNIKHYVGEQ